MANETVYDSKTDFSQLIGEVAAPTDFNPDAKAFEQAPVGLHLMEVYDFEVVPDKDFTCKVNGVRTTFYLTQLRPKLKVVGGQHDGATVNDFLPVPTPGREIPTMYANEWANFVKGIGFDLPQGQLVPAGFKLQSIIGRRAMVKIVQSTDADGRPKLSKQGEPYNEPAFFGYSRPETRAASNPSGSTQKPAAAPTAPTPTLAPAMQPVAAAASTFNVDL